MDGTGTNDRAKGGKARLENTTATWGTLKRLYLKPERPRARRYGFVACIELTDVELETHVTEQTSNLSLFGCRVDSEKLLLAGTRVRIRIVHTGASFVAFGKIVYASPKAGMGVSFIEIEPNHQLVLENWIAQLRDSHWRTAERLSSVLRPVFSLVNARKLKLSLEDLVQLFLISSEISKGLRL